MLFTFRSGFLWMTLPFIVQGNITGINCGQWATADEWDTSDENIKNIGAKEGSGTIAAGTCGRFGCYDTSGLFVCNDQDVDIEVPYSEVAEIASYALDTCFWGCSSDGACDFWTRGSGQIFTDNHGGYNVNLGYCDGNDGISNPKDYGPPNDGVNGYPKVICGLPGSEQCSIRGPSGSGAQCSASALTVTSQESVTCNEYLGPTYIGAGSTYTYSTQRSIGTTWNVGGFLGINIGDLSGPLGLAGFSASYSETTTTGDISGSSQDCGDAKGDNGLPGNWTCTMDIAPKCIHIEGTCASTDPVIGTVPYDVYIPQTANDGQAVYTANICNCHDCNGWADGGAPSNPCNLPCATCDTPPGGY